ncbi:hypothetical protein F8154_05460 [Alkaliphilus pronyensis]|uniref:Uncharacterized protein n=1 Tax=Alkaliphilus pronyensis TaxID=1482732 RepID=A0A6I0F0E0_9FIRM|nr:hypothetical protein [Alkaliphilus pronyensis]KAB3535748.1 hypothetical protein F8154_05460 [Alkaliphilus pronyensis]
MNLLKPFGSQNFILGVGIAALSYLLGPSLKQGARTVAVKGMQGAMMAGNTATNMMESGKESMGNLFDSMTGHQKDYMEMEHNFRQDLIKEIKSDREEFNSALKELSTTMKSLQSEVQALKKTANDAKLKDK